MFDQTIVIGTLGGLIGTVFEMPPFAFRRDDHPKPRPRVIPIKKIGPTDQLQCVILSPWQQGFVTHWLGGKTVPCNEDAEKCPGCIEKAVVKKYGFLHCALKLESFFVELTEYAWDEFHKQFEHMGYSSCRGLQVVFQRERKTVRSPVRVTIRGMSPIVERLPEERSVVPTLTRIFGLD